MTRPLRLLSIGHSYVVALNRRLPHELARVGAGKWEVTVAAPSFVHGDLRPIPLEPFPGEACRLISVPMYMTRRAHVMLYGQTVRRLLREPWDLVHCWEEPYVVAGFQLARWIPRKTPFVFWTAQNLRKRYPLPFAHFERYSLGRCAGWEACGHTTVTALQPRGYSNKPHRVLPLGVDVGVFKVDKFAGQQIQKSVGWNEVGTPVIGYMGRFAPEKGLRLLIVALDSIKTPWRGLFVGGGILEGDLRAWAAKYTDGRVKIVTGVAHEAVPPYLNAMDVLAAPSQTTPKWREQFGRMLIEAMACGVPVVGSDSGEIPYVIGDAGVVLPEADPGAWAKTLAELIADPNRRAELGAKGRARAESHFAWPVIAQQRLNFFEQLLHTSSTAAVHK